jgi:hypothetical protein
MQERIISLVVALGSIWGSVALVSIFAPDFVSGSEQEHLAFPAMFTWISGAFATRSVAGELVRRRTGKLEARYVWAGVAAVTSGIWLVVALVSIFAPRMETGSDPTRIPIAALLAPIAGAIATAWACGYARVLDEGLE